MIAQKCDDCAIQSVHIGPWLMVEREKLFCHGVAKESAMLSM